jgi:alkanesulfonate monooxygenase SsuD/methylene tetrahydromethanopterin reductase-like flavin-dependent oxidoreductase (luciferase family)
VFVPTLRPESPRFASGAERMVWRALGEQLGPDDVIVTNFRVTDRVKDHEADFVLLLPGAGVVVVEVKGGSVWRVDDEWYQSIGPSGSKRINPVEQARECKYAIRDYVERDPRWYANRRRRVRWAHAVVLPHSSLPDNFDAPDCPRWAVADRTNIKELAAFLRAIPDRQETECGRPDPDDIAALLDVLAGRGQAQRDVVAEAEARDVEAQRLTENQALILDAIHLLPRVEVRGGAGSGKTWLAVEQARRLTHAGHRVALLCYSRGLAAYLRRHVATLPYTQRPAYVGEFHSLGFSWGAETGIGDDDSDYWEHRLPAQMAELANALPPEQRFDAIIVDEAQDFADDWWIAVLAALKDEQSGGLYVFSDEGQRVFSRFGQPPVPLVPLMFDQNLRNTRQIAATFSSLAPMRMRLFGGDGPAVRFVESSTEDALDVGDDQVDVLIDDGWRPGDIALLTTGSRHPEQVARQDRGQDWYWDTFWDADQVFYGHVLGFKGLERRAVVLVLNETKLGERSRERLYVGLSRARDQLIVCGSSDIVRQLGGRGCPEESDERCRLIGAPVQRIAAGSYLAGQRHGRRDGGTLRAVRFAISISQLDTGSFDATGVKEYLARAEDLGFESGWVLEQSIGPTPLIAPLELLAYAAACTERLRLGVAVFVSTLHDPVQLAAAVTAVDRLSHGRLEIGVAAGGGFRNFPAFGMEREHYITRFVEGLQLMKAAWSDAPTITFHGRYRKLDDVPIQPKPVQRPHPPIWFGGSAPAALARAVRHADGFMGAGSSTTASFAEQVGIVRRELEQQGRDAAGFPIGKRVYLAVDNDADRAHQHVLAGLHRIYGGMPGIENVPVFGTPADVVEQLRDVADAGAELLVLNPLGADVAEDRGQMERLAAEVIPHLRAPTRRVAG